MPTYTPGSGREVEEVEVPTWMGGNINRTENGRNGYSHGGKWGKIRDHGCGTNGHYGHQRGNGDSRGDQGNKPQPDHPQDGHRNQCGQQTHLVGGRLV